MDKPEIMWDIRGDFNGLWLLILLEIIVNVVFISGVNELEVQWNLTEGLECLTSLKWFSLDQSGSIWNSSVGSCLLSLTIGLKVVSIFLMLFLTVNFSIVNSSSLPN
jgi:hypothetical protein